MSCNYYPETEICFAEIFNGRLTAFGVTEFVSAEAKEGARALTDGDNVLWIYQHSDGNCSATRYGSNDPSKIFRALEQVFGLNWKSEFDVSEGE